MLMALKKNSKLLDIFAAHSSTVWNGFLDMATNVKTPRLMKRIGTHDGVFHCDEALACFMLQQLPVYEEVEIVRTRDPEILKSCDIVVDVGGEYNHKTKRYDHHQRQFSDTFSTVCPDLTTKKTIKLSSAGLIYAHYGLEVLSEILTKNEINVSSECLNSLYLGVYENFIEEIDAIDNGIPMHPEGQALYKITTHLSARVQRINPEWNAVNPEPQDKLFKEAIALVGKEFVEKILELERIWWPARKIVKNAILNRFRTHKSGEIIELTKFCPWIDHFFKIEEEEGIQGILKFCIFPGERGSWRVRAIPLQADSFICRVFLHPDWRGLRGDELVKVSGISGAGFCHSTGFIGGNNTREGAINMAVKSLEAAMNGE